MISIIVAVAENYAIGKDNQLLWHLPDDMKRFKRLTTGHTVIMGKKTWESLPKRPLTDRRNIVITDDPNDHFEGAETVMSIEEALALCNPEEENFIMGGASIYQQFLPLTDRLYLTRVHKTFDGDAFFPELNLLDWERTSRDDYPPDEHNDFGYTYYIFDRIPRQ
ncbi:MAG: dihydrofolate reductase [Bacteroidetes bacterium]|nr:MAG: dihydrofolate reductase [Bacteroidota bacterium]